MREESTRSTLSDNTSILGVWNTLFSLNQTNMIMMYLRFTVRIFLLLQREMIWLGSTICRALHFKLSQLFGNNWNKDPYGKWFIHSFTAWAATGVLFKTNKIHWQYILQSRMTYCFGTSITNTAKSKATAAAANALLAGCIYIKSVSWAAAAAAL
jgi:hypothetical protein